MSLREFKSSAINWNGQAETSETPIEFKFIFQMKYMYRYSYSSNANARPKIRDGT